MVGPQQSYREEKINWLSEDPLAQLLSISSYIEQTEWSNDRALVVSQSEFARTTGCSSRITHSKFFVALETRNMTCSVRHVHYALNVTYVQGIRQLSYEMNDLDPQPALVFRSDFMWNNSAQIRDVKPSAPDLSSTLDTTNGGTSCETDFNFGIPKPFLHQ